MLKAKITFNNHSTIKVQAQIFVGRALISTCLAAPGESGKLTAASARYDVYFKNGATGREVARKLDSEADTFTLNQNKQKYTVLETKESVRPDLAMESRLAVGHSTK